MTGRMLLALAAICCIVWAGQNTELRHGHETIVPTAVLAMEEGVLDGIDAITIPRMLSYQGRLTDLEGRAVPDDNYPVAFRLYTVPSGGSAFWNENQTVTTSAGLFSVLLGSATPIAALPDAGALYLGMAVGGGAELEPRLRIVSAAYAYKADTANYALAAPGAGDNAWTRTDSVLFTINRLGIARGSVNNTLYGSNAVRSTHVNLGSGCTTGVSGQNNFYATVAGGTGNRAHGAQSAVGGGSGNIASGWTTTVAGGHLNVASGDRSVVAGGYQNAARGVQSAVSGGESNIAGNVAADSVAVVAGGRANQALAKGAAIGGGISNTANGGNSVIAGGFNNTVNPAASLGVIGGGGSNRVTSNATVSGGSLNTASGSASAIAGGYACTTSAAYGFAVGNVSRAVHSNSAAFNGQTTTAANQTRVGALSKASGTFTIDHPLDPHGRILNHYFIEGPEMRNIYDGETVLDASGRAVVQLPDYFAALNRNPRVQLTGVGSSDVYLAEKVTGNRFVIGGTPGIEVYWQVTGERQDISAEATRRIMPVEQPKTGDLAGRMLDDEFLSGCMEQLEREGNTHGIEFRTAGGRQRYERTRQHQREAESR